MEIVTKTGRPNLFQWLLLFLLLVLLCSLSVGCLPPPPGAGHPKAPTPPHPGAMINTGSSNNFGNIQV
jgi:hypothetical protein